MQGINEVVPPQPVTAKRVRVSVDLESGKAMVTLQRDGVTVRRDLVTAGKGIELSYLFPPIKADSRPHKYVLTVTGDATVRFGGTTLIQGPPLNPIKLTEDTTEGELQLPVS